MSDNSQILIYQWPWQRIDARLTSQFPYSRNFFQHILERGGVTVISAKSDNKLAIWLKVKKSYKLQEDDQVHIENLERFLDGGILEECPEVTMDIRSEKEDYLIIYKPKGMLSHPNSVWDMTNPSVVGGLYHYFKNRHAELDSASPWMRSWLSSGWRDSLPTTGNFIRAGLVHRLDKDTDGLMIIAKTEKGLTHFKQLFQKKSEASRIEAKEQVPLKKYYRAICDVTTQGQQFLEKIQNKLPYIIQEDVIAKVPHSIPKEGITKILSINKPHCEENLATTWQSPRITKSWLTPQYWQGKLSRWCMVIQIEILTWRTHQIRYHLSNHWLPIKGDYLYGREEKIPMQLTARKLMFVDPDGESQTISLED